MRTLLYKSMLEADFSVRYWDTMIRRHVTREQHLRLAAALMSSGTAGTLIFSLGEEWLWKILSVLTASISIYLTWAGHGRPVQRMSSLKKACMEGLLEYEHLWASLESGIPVTGLWARFEEARKKLMNGTNEDSEFPRDDALRHLCQKEVLQARGLKRKE